jgi:hypothetical protein
MNVDPSALRRLGSGLPLATSGLRTGSWGGFAGGIAGSHGGHSLDGGSVRSVALGAGLVRGSRSGRLRSGRIARSHHFRGSRRRHSSGLRWSVRGRASSHRRCFRGSITGTFRGGIAGGFGTGQNSTRESEARTLLQSTKYIKQLTNKLHRWVGNL